MRDVPLREHPSLCLYCKYTKIILYMKIQELFQEHNSKLSAEQIMLLSNNCKQFLSMTDKPLLKGFLNHTEDFVKMKIRFHKRQSDLIDIFNEAFFNKFNVSNFHQRSIFANGERSFVKNKLTQPYYVFPTNEFKFAYSREIKNSNSEYQNTFESLLEKIELNVDNIADIVKDLMIYSYVENELERGIVEGCEIIIYNIPYYYAVNANTFPNYNELLQQIKR